MPPDIEIFSNYICDLINLESQRLIEFYSQESLYFQENNSEEDSNSDGEESAESEDSDFDPDQEKEKPFTWESKIGYDKMVEISFYHKKNSRLKTARHFGKSVEEIDSIIKSVKKGPSKLWRLKLVSEQLLNKFNEYERTNLNISGNDLHRWALELAIKFGVPNFKCSKSYLDQFKKSNNIGSRMVTVFTTKKKLNEQENLIKKAQEFNQKINKIIEENQYTIIINSDQSRFEYEMFYKRTLATRGQKKIIKLVNQIPKTTHSFTIQPSITIDGDILDHMLIVLQETQGLFGVEVVNEVTQLCKKYKNLIIVPSKSGKCTKQIMDIWYKNVINPLLEDHRVLLLLDDWAGQRKKEFLPVELRENEDEDENSDKPIKIELIPPGTTGMCQPEDVFFFNPYKNFARRCTSELKDRIFLQINSENRSNYPQPHEREFIARLHSLILRQFSSSLYKPMIRGAWRLAGYETVNNDEKFDSIIQYQFRNFSKQHCEDFECENTIFAKCSICELELCFDCFIFSNNLIHHHFEESAKPIILDYKALNLVKNTKKRTSQDANLDDEDEEN